MGALETISAQRLHNQRPYRMADQVRELGPGPWVEVPHARRAFQVTVTGGRALVCLEATMDPIIHPPFTLDFGPSRPEEEAAAYQGTRAYSTHEPWPYVRYNIAALDEGAAVDMHVAWGENLANLFP